MQNSNSLPTYNLIATDRPGSGDHTIIVTSDVYEYDASSGKHKFFRVNSRPYFLGGDSLSGDSVGTQVNAVLVGGDGNDYLDFESDKDGVGGGKAEER